MALDAQTLSALKVAYGVMGDIRNNWRGRHTVEGQRALSVMRDAIAEAEGREPSEVQDAYAMAYTRA